MADVLYNSFIDDLSRGKIDLETETIKGILVTDAYVPNKDTHTKRSNVTNEVTGTAYTAGGQTLASKTVTLSAANNRVTLDAADLLWAASTITARALVLYVDKGTAATDLLIGYFDFNENKISTNGNFEVQFNANGIFTMTKA